MFVVTLSHILPVRVLDWAIHTLSRIFIFEGIPNYLHVALVLIIVNEKNIFYVMCISMPSRWFDSQV